MPNDLFYPVAVESVGVFLKKSVPHGNQPVLWVRLDDDGFTKWKGFRIEKKGTAWRDAVKELAEILQRYCTENKASADSTGFYEFKRINGAELIPQAHLGTPALSDDDFAVEAKKAVLNYLTTQWRLNSGLL